MSLIVTGTVGIDTVHAPTGSRKDVLGGSCTYFAAAASFFTPVRIVAAVGADFPEEHFQVFKHFSGIDTTGLEVRPGSSTFRWGGRYLENMNERETLYTELGVVAEDPPKVPDEYRASDYVFLANSHPSVQMDLLSQIPERKLAIADTMDLWINSARQELGMLMEEVDGLILNDSEALMLTGERNLRQAADRIRGMGPGIVIIKKGEHGVMMVHDNGIAVLPAYPTASVVDPTGAGDSFAGGMMGSIAAENDHSFAALQRALGRGTVIASYNVESFTLERLQSLTAKDVVERLEEFRRICRF